MPRLPLALCVAALSLATGAGSAGAAVPVLRHIGYGITPATTDGGRYVVWVRTNGALAVYDTRTRRARTTPPLCGATGPTKHLGTTPISADRGIAVFSCGDFTREFTEGSYFEEYVRLGDLAHHRLLLPARLRATPFAVAVGRYWLTGGTVRDPSAPPLAPGDPGMGGFMLNRRDHRVLLPRPDVVLDPDSPNGSRLRATSRQVTLVLDSGFPYLPAVIGDGVIINDPFARKPRVLRASGCMLSCGAPFGSARRAVYTIGYQVRLVVDGKEEDRWFVLPTPPPPGEEPDQDLIFAALTPATVVVSRSDLLRRFDVLIAGT